MELKIEYVPIESLTPYKNNARKHESFDINFIKRSIQEFGFDDPIGVWGENNLIVEGHGRLIAAKELGMTEVPIIRLDHLTDDQRKAYALAHNRTAEMSEWDTDTLMEELDKLADQFDLKELGFAQFMDLEEPEEVKDDDFDEDEYFTEESQTQNGDIYVLRDHRLICGDSTKQEVINKLIGERERESVYFLLIHHITSTTKDKRA